MPISTVIFDVDGTLVENTQIIIKLFQDVVSEYLGQNMSDSEVLSLWGPPGDEIFRKIFPDSLFVEAWNKFLNKYRASSPSKGFFSRDELQRLKDHLKFLVIFTGKSRTTYEITIEKLGFADLFHLVMTGNDVERSKPYPDALFQIISILNLNKEEVMFLGDSHLDIIAGKAAGIKTAAALWGSVESEKLLSSNPDYLFSNPNDFLEFILNK
ncbi:HAD family hydrolase [Candidatus Hodarchaeum mangrovi]